LTANDTASLKTSRLMTNFTRHPPSVARGLLGRGRTAGRARRC
jgi:hypothetical protein